MLRKIIKNIIDSLIEVECFFTKKEKHENRRVLILRKDTLGDYIIFYPTLKSYREFYKDAEVTLVISKLFKDLSPLLKVFENIIWFDAKKFSSNFFYRRRFLLNLKKKGYDVAIQPTFSRESTGDFMIKLTKAPVTIGVNGDLTASTREEKEKNNKVYTKLINVPKHIITEIDKNRFIVEEITNKKIEIKFPTIDVNIFSDEKSKDIIEKNNLESKKYVIFFSGSGTTFKIWPKEKFAEIVDYLIEKGFTPVLCGDKGEFNLVNGILEKVVNKNVCVNLVGETDLGTMIHLLKNSAFYFGSDTGITHLAATIQVPTLCIMGGGHFGRFFPYGDLEKNRIVFDEEMKCKNDNWECSKNLKEGESAPCIKNIKVSVVKREIDIMIKRYE